MRTIVILGLLSFLLTSCDQLNYAYLTNKTKDPINVSLFFNDYDSTDKDGRKNIYVKYLLEDSVIRDNAKLFLLDNKTARVDFNLRANTTIELMFDTAPLSQGKVKFDKIKIISNKETLELEGNEEIFKKFKPTDTKTERYIIIEE